MLLSKKLWESNIKIAFLCLETKFVQGIKYGNLPKNKFQSYVAQDYYFLKSFAKAYESSIVKIKNKKSSKTLNDLLIGVSEELILHKSYAKKWDIDLNTNILETATKKYTDFLDELSQNGSYIEIIHAMTPCMRLYSWIGKRLYNGNISEDNPYKEWVLTYSDDSFETLAKSLENLIDQYNENYDDDKTNDLYREAMKLELAFFENYSQF